MCLSARVCQSAALIYLTVPTLIFQAGFLQPGIAATAILLTAIALIQSVREKDDETISFPRLISASGSCIELRFVLFAMLVALGWCVLCGQGGCFYQKWDWNFRNACFRDLISHDWPVRYTEYKKVLAYYVGTWLPSACLTKGICDVSRDTDLAWLVGNWILLLWIASGVALSLIWLFLLLGVKTLKAAGVATIVFICFGGLDVIPASPDFIDYLLGVRSFSILENWMGTLEFESNTTQLAWVFHQAVPAWLSTLYLLSSGKIRNLGFVLAVLVICSPLPSIGILLLLFLIYVLYVPRRDIITNLRAIFSVQNVLGILVVFPLAACYLFANPKAEQISFFILRGNPPDRLLDMLVFGFLEFGVYFLVLYRDWKGNPWFWSVLLALLMAMSLQIGARADFCMRASIPALITLQCLVLVSLQRGMKNGDEWVRRRKFRLVLLGVLVLGAMGSLVDIAETIQNTWKFWPRVNYNDQIFTFDQDADPNNIAVPDSPWDWRYHLDNFYAPTLNERFFK